MDEFGSWNKSLTINSKQPFKNGEIHRSMCSIDCPPGSRQIREVCTITIHLTTYLNSVHNSTEFSSLLTWIQFTTYLITEFVTDYKICTQYEYYLSQNLLQTMSQNTYTKTFKTFQSKRCCWTCERCQLDSHSENINSRVCIPCRNGSM